jgi:hypothetical protein
MTLDLVYFTFILRIIIADYWILELVWLDVDRDGL